jgi:hypothetical protein
MMNKQFLLIVTYGRSGSTLLQGILNSIDGFVIRGENQDAYASLLTFYMRLMDSLVSNKTMERNWKVYESTNSWWNDFQPEGLLQRLRDVAEFHLDMYGEGRVVGFKEINYPKHLKQGRDNLVVYLSFLHRLLGCRFIYLTRNLKDVSRSEWWASNPQKCVEKLGRFEVFMKDYIKNHRGGQDWFHLRYEDMVRGKLEKLFDWLGEPFDKEKVDKVLRTPHGYKSIGSIRTGGIE